MRNAWSRTSTLVGELTASGQSERAALQLVTRGEPEAQLTKVTTILTRSCHREAVLLGRGGQGDVEKCMESASSVRLSWR